MGIRCLLGHDFSEPEIEREREEDGEEVVTTVREVKTCDRCGETQVVSENTEVTTMEQLTDQATTAEATESGEPTAPTEPSGPAAPTEPTEAADEPGGRATSTEPSSRSAGTDRSPDVDYGGAHAGVDAADPAGDDAEILEDSPGGGETAVDESADDGPTTDSTAGDAAIAAADEDAELIDAGPDGDAADGGSADAGGDAAGSDGTGTPSGPADPAGATDAAVPDRDRASDASDGPDLDRDGDVADDDGVILDGVDADDAGDRDRGEWPDVDADDDDDETFESTPWPEQRGDDEGFSAELGEDGDSGVEFGGLTPEAAEPAAESADAEYVEPADRPSAFGSAEVAVGGYDSDDAAGEEGSAPDSGITREENPQLETEGSTGVPTEYYCPECGMTVRSAGSSMRAGDICPECKRGYVAERSR
ncbi:hypothetical protein ACFPM1_05795 [Halorubrum rubrum]|uniref:Oxidoreductase n=1 Tax=Halorubrum rubrum TaxID=1126240 RepID=A0ABD5R026_9EURY|nr:hypothetical protein [Halorubrum rubrum]